MKARNRLKVASVLLYLQKWLKKYVPMIALPSSVPTNSTTMLLSGADEVDKLLKKARTSGAVLLEIKTLRRMNGCCSGFTPESQQISSTRNCSMYAGEA